MKVKRYVLCDLKTERDLGADEYKRSVADPDMYRNRVGFDCLLYIEKYKKLFCGLAAFDNDIFYTFDPATKKYESLGYSKIAEKYEVKIHRSLTFDGNKTIYTATACLHDASLYMDAKGGRIFSYDIESKKYETLAAPFPHNYIQTITLDMKRRIIYAMTYPNFNLIRFDIDTRKVTNIGFMGSITHISALDDKGRFWGTWHQRHHKFYRYDPDANKVEFFDFNIPNATGGTMYAGAGPVDTMINGGDGFIYIGITDGALVRLDPEKLKIEFLGKPFAEGRMPGLEIGSDNLIYGIGGDDGKSFLFTYDRSKRSFNILGEIKEPGGIGCHRSHDIAIVDKKTIYVAESDNPRRACYLWECKLV
ncbi:MAG: hypothetical protein V2A57_03550 [Elusimicrobiota bacterium]